MVVNRIQEKHSVNAFQRPLLPVLGFFQYFVRDPANRAFWHLYAVNIADVFIDIVAGHSFCIHGYDLGFDIFTDTGLVFLENLWIEFAFPIPGNSDFRVSETGLQGFAAVAIPAVVCRLLWLIVALITKFFIQFALKSILHEPGDCLLEQILDVRHAGHIRCFQHFVNLFSSGHLLRGSFQNSPHFNYHAGAAPAQIGMKTGRRKIARFLVKSAWERHTTKHGGGSCKQLFRC